MLMAACYYPIFYTTCVFVIQTHVSTQLKVFKCSLQAKVSATKPHATMVAPAMMRSTRSSASVPQGGKVQRVT